MQLPVQTYHKILHYNSTIAVQISTLGFGVALFADDSASKRFGRLPQCPNDALLLAIRLDGFISQN